jgi:hypothetical protein
MARPKGDITKTRYVTVRLTPEEHLKLLEAADRSRLSVSEHVRRSALKIRATKIRKEGKLRYGPLQLDIYHELRRQGVNLNQIARHCNRFAVPPGPAFTRLQTRILELLDEFFPAP